MKLNNVGNNWAKIIISLTLTFAKSHFVVFLGKKLKEIILLIKQAKIDIKQQQYKWELPHCSSNLSRKENT